MEPWATTQADQRPLFFTPLSMGWLLVAGDCLHGHRCTLWLTRFDFVEWEPDANLLAGTQLRETTGLPEAPTWALHHMRQTSGIPFTPQLNLDLKHCLSSMKRRMIVREMRGWVSPSEKTILYRRWRRGTIGTFYPWVVIMLVLVLQGIKLWWMYWTMMEKVAAPHCQLSIQSLWHHQTSLPLHTEETEFLMPISCVPESTITPTARTMIMTHHLMLQNPFVVSTAVVRSGVGRMKTKICHHSHLPTQPWLTASSASPSCRGYESGLPLRRSTENHGHLHQTVHHHLIPIWCAAAAVWTTSLVSRCMYQMFTCLPRNPSRWKIPLSKTLSAWRRSFTTSRMSLSPSHASCMNW